VLDRYFSTEMQGVIIHELAHGRLGLRDGLSAKTLDKVAPGWKERVNWPADKTPGAVEDFNGRNGVSLAAQANTDIADMILCSVGGFLGC